MVAVTGIFVSCMRRARVWPEDMEMREIKKKTPASAQLPVVSLGQEVRWRFSRTVMSGDTDLCPVPFQVLISRSIAKSRGPETGESGEVNGRLTTAAIIVEAEENQCCDRTKEQIHDAHKRAE